MQLIKGWKVSTFQSLLSESLLRHSKINTSYKMEVVILKRIILTTESCSDLSKEILEEHNIPSVPFSLNFPDKTVDDGQIPVQEIYDFYRDTKEIPKTNAITPYKYTEFFDGIAKKNPNAEIIHIGYSSACSCSFQNATIGVRECKKAKVHLVDSLNVSGGLGSLALKAWEVIQENPQDSAAELVRKIQLYVAKIRMSFIPDTMEYLLAGGRVSNAAALTATVLRLKPRIDIVEGKLIATKKYRGSMQKIVSRFVEDFMEGKNFDLKKVHAFYSQGTDPLVMERLKSQLIEHGFKEIVIGTLGCVMTVHGGPGVVGLSAIEL